MPGFENRIVPEFGRVSGDSVRTEAAGHIPSNDNEESPLYQQFICGDANRRRNTILIDLIMREIKFPCFPINPLISSVRHRAFGQGGVCPGGSGFIGHAAQQAHGGAMRAGAVAHALYIRLSQFANRRAPGYADFRDLSVLCLFSTRFDFACFLRATASPVSSIALRFAGLFYRATLRRSFLSRYASLRAGPSAERIWIF